MLKFNDNKTFKIMQITDIQENPQVSEDTIALMENALEQEKPDLVVYTGDQIKGYGVTYKGMKEELLEQVTKTISTLLKPVTDRNIPFAVTFGNHDQQVGLSNDVQFEKIYKKLPGCIGEITKGLTGGTFQIPVYDSTGEKVALQIYLFDSGGDAKGGGYNAVDPKVLTFYKKIRQQRMEENQGKYVPSIVFQHIPMPEYYNVLKKVKKGTKNAIRAYRTHKNEYYVLGDCCGEEGSFLEPPSIPDVNVGEYEVLAEKGEVFAMYVGHDHKNNFIGKCDHMDLGYTCSCGFHVYGNGVERGVRVFEFKEDNPKDYSTRMVTFREVVNRKVKQPILDFMYSNAPATLDAAIPVVIKGVLLIGVIVAGILYLKMKK